MTEDMAPASSTLGVLSRAVGTRQPIDWARPLETEESHPRPVLAARWTERGRLALLAEDEPWGPMAGFVFDAAGLPVDDLPGWSIRNVRGLAPDA